MMLKVNKADMAGMMETIKEYFRSCNSVVRAPLAFLIRKTIIVKTYSDFSKHVTFDDKMMIKMLHLSQDKNKYLLWIVITVQSRRIRKGKKVMTELFMTHDQICKDKDLNS